MPFPEYIEVSAQAQSRPIEQSLRNQINIPHKQERSGMAL